MRAKTIQIIWHDKQPVFSVDFDPIHPLKFASCGGDNNVRIWTINNGNIEYISTLSRHSAAVNCVRFSPQGILASGGDGMNVYHLLKDGSILLWEQTDKRQNMLDDDEDSKEYWRVSAMLRGTTSDLYDLCWSPDGKMIASAGIDSSVRIFDIKEQKCIHVLTDHNHFIQGIAWDPLYKFLASQSSDRSMHVYKYDQNNSKSIPQLLARHAKVTYKTENDTDTQKDTQDRPSVKSNRIFQDENLNSFFRRLQFSPDGSILIAPAGINPMNTSRPYAAYMFNRDQLKSPPFAMLSNHRKPVIAIRFNPIKYKLRTFIEGDDINSNLKESNDSKNQGTSFTKCDYRYIFALATQDSVILYDTQHSRPIACFENFHYASISDIAWSINGSFMIISSTDGFCTVVEFAKFELGTPVENENNFAGKMQDEKSSALGEPVSNLQENVQVITLSSTLIKRKSNTINQNLNIKKNKLE